MPQTVKFNSLSLLMVLLPVLFIAGCNITGKPAKENGHGNKPELILHTDYLDQILLENSGLVWFRNKLWAINDSGGEPVLFAIDMQTGKCIQAIYIDGAINRDWEELAQDENFIYIFDIGNNYGRKKELTIYKVFKDSIPFSGNARIAPEIIHYRYGDMEKNNGFLSRSPYDCEAAFALHDSLYIFTKDWVDQHTTLYICPASPGSYTLWPVKTYEADGLVTGADISPDSSFIMLIGYKDYVPFVWEFRDFNFTNYTMGSARRLDFPEYYDLQTEGIAIQTAKRIYISCEMSSLPASVYTLNLGIIFGEGHNSGIISVRPVY